MFSSRLAFIGFLIGAGVPVTCGVIGLTAPVEPLPPGSYRCGLSSLADLGLIFFVGPIGGLVGTAAGATVGWISSQMVLLFRGGLSAK